MAGVRRTEPVVRNGGRGSAGTDLQRTDGEKVACRGGALDFKLGGGPRRTDADIAEAGDILIITGYRASESEGVDSKGAG